MDTDASSGVEKGLRVGVPYLPENLFFASSLHELSHSDRLKSVACADEKLPSLVWFE